MRIAYFGDGPWAHLALQRIFAAPGWTVVAIGARNSSPDPVLRAMALEKSIPFSAPRNINAAETLDYLASLKPDIIVSMSFDQIFKRQILALAPLGLINVHAGALPFYRGRNVLNWAIINGETSFGVTCHHVDEGIDTGDIIVQRHVPIGPDDSYSEILSLAQSVCADVLHEALAALNGGYAARIPQASIHPVGFYCSRRVVGDEVLDWRLSEARVHDFVRGIAPPAPGARTFDAAREIAIVQSRRINNAPRYIGTPGDVVGRDEAGIIVKCGDATLRITKIALVEPDRRLGPIEVPKLPIGTRLKPHSGDRS